MNDMERMIRDAAGTLPGAAPELAIAGRAEEEGLLDVAYTSVDSPLGQLTVASTPRGLVRVSYDEFRERDQTLEELAERISPRVLESPAKLDTVRRELDEYFEGRRTALRRPGRLGSRARVRSRGVARHCTDRLRRDRHLRERRNPGGKPASGPSRRQRPRLEPDAGCGALPPRAPHRGGARRLHGRGGAQGVPAALGGRAALTTEREGFEPSMEVSPHTRLAGECLQPLGHLS